MGNFSETEKQKLRERLQRLPGNISMIYKDLSAGEFFGFQENEKHIAASVIKLFLMAAVYQGFEDGRFQKTDHILIRREDRVPSCGVLYYLQEEPSLCIRDLVELMIIVSDNTAANILFDLVGEEELNRFIHEVLQMPDTSFRRKMFDAERASKGIENDTTAADAAAFLERLYRGTLISKTASEEMYQILTHQRLNGKIPFYLHTLPETPVIAHKTGEDAGVTHDVGIIQGNHPFIIVFLGNDTDVSAYEREMAEISLWFYQRCRD